MNIICDLCNEETDIKQQIVFRKYLSRPFYRYTIIDRFYVCDKCFKRMREIIRRDK